LATWAGIIAWTLGLFLLILVGSRAAVELVDFTATTQADGSILLRWVTRWELDTSAFRIYRALTPNGPWDTVVNEQDSRSDGENDTVYEYLDSDVEPGKTYYYLLEELEVESVGGVNRYMDWVRSATAGQPGAPTFTPTATRTSTATATQGPTGVTPSPTATRTPTATGTPTDVPTAVPTATRQFTNTPVPQAQPTATWTPLPATSTPRPGTTVVAPIGQPGQPPSAVSPTASRPAVASLPGSVATLTPTTGPASPIPAPEASPTSTVTPTPAIFAAKVVEQPVLRATPTRASDSDKSTESVARDHSWILALAIGVVALAVLLAVAVFFLWRRHPG